MIASNSVRNARYAVRPPIFRHVPSVALLSHIGIDGEMVGHDVEEFAAVIQRHGAWKTDLSHFLEASNQQHLFNDPQRVNDHTDQVQ